MRRIALLGSTGSIGASTLDVVAHLGDRLSVASLAAGSNWQLLAQQAREFGPALVAIADAGHVPRLKEALSDTGIEVLGGADGVAAAAAVDGADVAFVAIVGAAGLPVSFAALSSGKALALANKESLVMAGELLTGLARERGLPIIPVDSEHSAVHQCLRSGGRGEVERIILTASGGPFRRFSRQDLERATPEMALRHPTWSMGAKVTVDSATLMNKALEIVEARWLFDVPAEKIAVVVHPQSVVHSMVEFKDGSTIAQLGEPDMRVPIQYALTYPERARGPARRLDWAERQSLAFEPPDTGRFPALLLGWRAASEGGTAGAVLNAANEVAVDLFLNRRISFADIARVTVRTMDAHRATGPASLDDVMAADRWAREKANALAPTGE
ncbi:MAG: 1-deoxy-D-xylulose-5-phosphate reductoisomerase [Planctomycetota bacterium]